jgi:serine/threonine protein kinase
VQGLQYIHSKQLVHLDIMPGNIFISLEYLIPSPPRKWVFFYIFVLIVHCTVTWEPSWCTVGCNYPWIFYPGNSVKVFLNLWQIKGSYAFESGSGRPLNNESTGSGTLRKNNLVVKQNSRESMATEERFTSLYTGEFICNLSVLEIEIVQQKLIFCYAPSSKGGVQ